jgi:hypothetical protein
MSFSWSCFSMCWRKTTLARHTTYSVFVLFRVILIPLLEPRCCFVAGFCTFVAHRNQSTVFPFWGDFGRIQSQSSCSPGKQQPDSPQSCALLCEVTPKLAKSLSFFLTENSLKSLDMETVRIRQGVQSLDLCRGLLSIKSLKELTFHDDYQVFSTETL